MRSSSSRLLDHVPGQPEGPTLQPRAGVHGIDLQGPCEGLLRLSGTPQLLQHPTQLDLRRHEPPGSRRDVRQVADGILAQAALRGDEAQLVVQVIRHRRGERPRICVLSPPPPRAGQRRGLQLTGIAQPGHEARRVHQGSAALTAPPRCGAQHRRPPLDGEHPVFSSPQQQRFLRTRTEHLLHEEAQGPRGTRSSVKADPPRVRPLLQSGQERPRRPAPRLGHRLAADLEPHVTLPAGDRVLHARVIRHRLEGPGQRLGQPHESRPLHHAGPPGALLPFRSALEEDTQHRCVPGEHDQIHPSVLVHVHRGGAASVTQIVEAQYRRHVEPLPAWKLDVHPVRLVRRERCASILRSQPLVERRCGVLDTNPFPGRLHPPRIPRPIRGVPPPGSLAGPAPRQDEDLGATQVQPVGDGSASGLAQVVHARIRSCVRLVGAPQHRQTSALIPQVPAPAR